MDFDRLRVLAAVARTGSVRGAAAALHVTPGAVSKAISRLEAECEVALVAPRGRGIVLTADGAWLARRAEHLVGEHASLGSDLSSRRGRDAGFCIASYDVFVEWFPAVVARQFLPGVPMSVRERYPGEIESAVATRVSDVGITWTPVPTEGVTHRSVARVELGVYAARGAFPGERTSDLPFVVPMHPVSGALSQYGPLDGWPADAPPREVRYQASALEARLAFARAGQAAVVLPTFVAERHNATVLAAQRLERRTAPRGIGPLTRRLHLVHPSDLSPLLRERIEAVSAAVSVVTAST